METDCHDVINSLIERVTAYMGHIKRKSIFKYARNDSNLYRACTKFHQGICSQLIHSIISTDSVS